MARRLIRAMFAAFTAGLASCTIISGVGDLEVEDTALDAAPETSAPASEATVTVPPPPENDAGDPDASLLGDPDASVVDACSPTGCFSLPLGFQLVAFGVKGAPCPTGFANPTDVVEDPKITGNACACDCDVSQPPVCPFNGTLASKFSAAGTGCTNDGQVLSGGCNTDGFLGPFSTSNNDRTYVPPGPVGGSCNATATKNMAALSTGSHRLCQASVIPQCDAKVCLPPGDKNFKACIAASGTPTCPPDFPKQTVVGTKADFDCPVANCACSVAATCTGRLHFYDNDSCGGAPAVSFFADGTCHGTTAAGGPYLSHKYVPDPPSNVTCNKSGSSTATTPTLTQVTTVCCN